MTYWIQKHGYMTKEARLFIIKKISIIKKQRNKTKCLKNSYANQDYLFIQVGMIKMSRQQVV